ncbi:hypothetical protein V1286_002006 [Bradyrhizobium algeriense]|uniref:Uncharacterized protein n=1 Tax=Bradyrhizobium algeriense TaxID=634784 RepID=A0ABU8B7G1_9BRAD
MTMLPTHQLANHSSHFGPVSLEFSALSARKLGAVPLIYLPQAASDQSQATLDKVGYFFVYRIAELQQLCERVFGLQQSITQHAGSDLITFKEAESGQSLRINNRQLQALLKIIIGQNDLREFVGVLTALSSLFYPTDAFRHSVDLTEDPLYYYFQREWRLLSGLTVDGDRIDGPLTSDERKMVLDSNPDFFGKNITLRHRQLQRIDACTIIRTVEGRPVRELVSSVSVPTEWEDKTRNLLNEFDMGSLLRTIDNG